MRRSAVFLLSSFVSVVASAATAPVDPVDAKALYQPESAQSPVMRGQRVGTVGGTARLRLDAGLLGDIGLRIVGNDGKAFAGDYAYFDFSLAKGSRFEFDARPRAVLDVAGGSGQLLGGVRFAGKRAIDWQSPRFVVRAGDPPRIDLVSADGDVLFYVDKLMYEMVDGDRTFSITTADVRMSRLLAERIGNLAFADHFVGDMSFRAEMETPLTIAEPKSCSVPNWPGATSTVPGEPYKADVFMTSFSGSTLGSCQACDGPGGASTGTFKMAPSSSLRNNVANGSSAATVPGDPLGTSAAIFSAEVPWQRKFSSPAPPYGVDQHPYLIWNVYKVDTNGQITQVGRSGVKHAFLTVNSGCLESCGNNQVLGRGCGDTYGTGNNDSSGDLGPRSELEPATGRWGRCHSIYDPNCDGSSADFAGYGTFTHRMVLREADVDASLPANTGSTWLFESWYIVREDINIYNTMATRPVTFTWSGSTWTTTNQSPLLLGPAIDRWYAGLTGTKRTAEIVAPEGHVKVAANATDLGNGTWRYDYAVMNFDFARTFTQGTPPNLDVIRNNGLKAFTIVRAPQANITSTLHVDGDANAANDWTVDTSNPTTITWTAPNDASSLNWGTMARFTVVADVAPAEADAVLLVTEPGSPASYSAASLAVGNDVLLTDGFED